MCHDARNALGHKHYGVDRQNDPQYTAVAFPKGGNLATLVFAATRHQGARSGSIGSLAIAVRELLGRARWGLVDVRQVPQQPKAGAEFVVQRVRRIPHDL